VGVQNRQRRAAKKRAWSRAGRPAPRAAGPRTGYEPVDLVRLEIVAAAGVAVDAGKGVAAALGRCAETLLDARAALPVREVASLVADMATEAVATAWERGWQPADLAAVARRRLPAEHLPVVCALVRAMTDLAPGARVDPRWRAQVAELPDVPAVADRVDRLAAWAATQDGLSACLGVIGLVRTLPVLPATLPLPGRASARPAEPGVDSRALARIRALLAKAESTEFPEEAEALSTKAQALMSRHAIDRLVVEAGAPDAPPVESRRLWLDPPYVLAKAHLADVVARANRCRAVCTERLGLVTVFGGVRDLDSVEMLTTSLLVQANRAMLSYGRRIDRHGRSRSRSFRQSFLVSYAIRIGERLAGAADGVVAEHPEPGRLLPVLRSHDRRVTEAVADAYPRVVLRGASASNGAGWAAGRSAADSALFDVHQLLVQAG
jgi:uncharacterized protein DUF2786